MGWPEIKGKSLLVFQWILNVEIVLSPAYIRKIVVIYGKTPRTSSLFEEPGKRRKRWPGGERRVWS